jgi:hypothetical protein
LSSVPSLGKRTRSSASFGDASEAQHCSLTLPARKRRSSLAFC